MCRAIDDGGVDHRALAGGAGFEDAREHPHHEIERPAADITDKRGRRHRRRAGFRGVMQRAGGGDIVEVMARRMGTRAVLSPAGHTAIDKGRVSA